MYVQQACKVGMLSCCKAAQRACTGLQECSKLAARKRCTSTLHAALCKRNKPHKCPVTGAGRFWNAGAPSLLFGDQTLFCRASDFARVGGYDAALPIMEDADLCIRLHNAGPGERPSQKAAVGGLQVLQTHQQS